MRKGIGFIVVLGIIAAFILWGIGQYNTLVKLDENVNAAWSQVENVYQRRADLVPNLVSVVRGCAEQETEIFYDVVQARSKATQVNVSNLNENNIREFQNVQDELSSSLGKMLTLAEGYPALKSSGNFQDLQARLEGTCNRIAEARRQYNNAAQTFNVKTRLIPTNIIASMFSFEQKGYFSAETSADL